MKRNTKHYKTLQNITKHYKTTIRPTNQTKHLISLNSNTVFTHPNTSY